MNGADRGMTINGFAAALRKRIEREVPRADVGKEADFERRHVIEPAWELAQLYPEIQVVVHPPAQKTRCKDRCDVVPVEFSRRVTGCSKCWSASKQWSVVEAFGTRHTFDLVARDREGGTLALEVKWLSLESGRGPNGEFQRFVGQCALATARHAVVIGVCGFRGRRTKAFDAHEGNLKKALERIGIVLIPLHTKT